MLLGKKASLILCLIKDPKGHTFRFLIPRTMQDHCRNGIIWGTRGSLPAEQNHVQIHSQTFYTHSRPVPYVYHRALSIYVIGSAHILWHSFVKFEEADKCFSLFFYVFAAVVHGQEYAFLEVWYRIPLFILGCDWELTPTRFVPQ